MSTDFRAAGRRAYETGKPGIPAADPAVRDAIAGMPVGTGAAAIMRDWTAGWQAALDESTPGMVTGNPLTLYRTAGGQHCVVIYTGPSDDVLYPYRGGASGQQIRVAYTDADGVNTENPRGLRYDWADPWTLLPVRELPELPEDDDDEDSRSDFGEVPAVWDDDVRDDDAAPGVTGDQFRDALDQARAAFWASIAGSFPNVTTGDMAPGDDTCFEWGSNAVVLTWLRWNHPANNEDDDQPPTAAAQGVTA